MACSTWLRQHLPLILPLPLPPYLWNKLFNRKYEKKGKTYSRYIDSAPSPDSRRRLLYGLWNPLEMATWNFRTIENYSFFSVTLLFNNLSWAKIDITWQISSFGRKMSPAPKDHIYWVAKRINSTMSREAEKLMTHPDSHWIDELSIFAVVIAEP